MIDIKDTDTYLQVRIKRWMNFYGWTRYRLQKHAEISEATIRGMLKKNHDPRFSSVLLVCKAFGLSLAEFFSDDAFPEEESEMHLVIRKWGQLNAEQRGVFMMLLDAFISSKEDHPQKKTKVNREDRRTI